MNNCAPALLFAGLCIALLVIAIIIGNRKVRKLSRENDAMRSRLGMSGDVS